MPSLTGSVIAKPDLAYSSMVMPLVVSGIGISMAIPVVQNAVFGAVSSGDVGRHCGLQPINRFHVNAPSDTLSAVFRLLAQHRAVPRAPTISGAWSTVDGQTPAAEVQGSAATALRTHSGEGVLEIHFDRCEPHLDPAPSRPHSDSNPLNHKEEYLLHIVRRV